MFSPTHVAISGGGPGGLLSIGALAELVDTGQLSLAGVTHMKAVSIGTLLTVGLAAGLTAGELAEYLVERPWHRDLGDPVDCLMSLYESRGLLGRNFFESALKPILLSRNMSVDVSLAEFESVTGVCVEFLTVELNSWTLVRLSGNSHPHLTVVDAVWMSSALPMLVCPRITDEGECYVDGALMMTHNFAKEWLDSGVPANTMLILAHKSVPPLPILSNANLTDFMGALVSKLVAHLCNRTSLENAETERPRTVLTTLSGLTPQIFMNVLNSRDMRAEWVNRGRAEAGLPTNGGDNLPDPI